MAGQSISHYEITEGVCHGRAGLARRVFCSIAGLVLIAAPGRAEPPENWPQFRGPSSAGLAGKQSPPTEFGPTDKVLWRTETPIGRSSPAVWGGRIFLTAFGAGKAELQTLAIDRVTGKVLWQRNVAPKEIEKVHSVSSPASATPAVDGDFVYVYFGSYGLLAFDHGGEKQWEYRLPVARLSQGSGVSPVVAGDRVILNRDERQVQFMVALDRRTGKEIWRIDHPPMPGAIVRESYGTPVVRDGRIYLHRAGELAVYSLEDGRRLWWLKIATTGTSTPVLTDDAVYVGGYTPLGEESHRIVLPTFDELAGRADADGNGALDRQEFPSDVLLFERPEIPNIPGTRLVIKRVFGMVDGDKNGDISRAEWDECKAMIEKKSKDHGLVKVRLDGAGDVTDTHMVWQENRAVPEAPSPLVVGKRAYMIKNGGIVTCLDAGTGVVKYRARLGALGAYYSSPVAAGGRIYVASSEGVVVVLEDGDSLNVLARNDLGEPIFATPAFVDSVIYLRTENALYAFGDE